jgi:flagellar hook-length control protein FliK
VHSEKISSVSGEEPSPAHSIAASEGPSSQQPASSHQKSDDDKQQGQQFSNGAPASPQLQPQSVKLQVAQGIQSPAAHQTVISLAAQPQHAVSSGAPDHAQTSPSSSTAGSLMKNAAPQPASALQYSPVISSTKLIEKLGQSELRIGFQTQDFGPVEIKTLLQNQELRAHISVEHTALRDALAADLPALQKNFEQQRIAVHSVEIQGQGAAWNGGGSSPRQSQQFNHLRNHLGPELKPEPRTAAADPVVTSQMTGIDLHA